MYPSYIKDQVLSRTVKLVSMSKPVTASRAEYY